MPDHRPGHRIAELSYRLNRLICTCGAVMAARPDGEAWREHRRDVGLRSKSIGGTIGKRLAPRA